MQWVRWFMKAYILLCLQVTSLHSFQLLPDSQGWKHQHWLLLGLIESKPTHHKEELSLMCCYTDFVGSFRGLCMYLLRNWVRYWLIMIHDPANHCLHILNYNWKFLECRNKEKKWTYFSKKKYKPKNSQQKTASSQHITTNLYV